MRGLPRSCAGPQPRGVEKGVGGLEEEGHLSLRWAGYSEMALNGVGEMRATSDGCGMGPLGRLPW